MRHLVIDKIIQSSPHLSWLKTNTILLVRSGSKAYGTNVAGSDDDFKSITIPTKEYFLGSVKRFEQAELKDPDAVIYDLRKFFTLAIDNNPNIVEVLYTDPEDIIFADSLGRKLIKHRDEFLSKKIKHTFLGYAVSQLKRMKLHRAYVMNPPKQPPTRKELGLPEHTLIPQDQLAAVSAAIKKELDKFEFDFLHLDDATKISIKNVMSEMLSELKITSDNQWQSAARKIGVDDNLILVMQKEREYLSRKKEWDHYQEWKKNRNVKRAELEAKFGMDLKHCYHLVRLIRMCREILTTGKVLVKRPDREELIAIRNGAWTYDQLIEFAESEEKALNEIYKTSILPKSPDKEKLDKLCISMIEDSLSKYSFYRFRKYFDF